MQGLWGGRDEGQRRLNITLAEVFTADILPVDLQMTHEGRGANRAFQELLWASEAGALPLVIVEWPKTSCLP